MSSEIVKPSDVDAPRQNWTLIKVLDDGDKDRGALAVGQWDKKPVLAIRWNGTDEKPKGNPISTGYPTWFILPSKFNEVILRSGLLSPDQANYVINFMDLRLIETFRGRIITPPEKPDYRIKRVERISVLDGRDYIVRVEPILLTPHSEAQPLTLRIHITYQKENADVAGKTGEEADGNLIITTLASFLNTHLEQRLSKKRRRTVSNSSFLE